MAILPGKKIRPSNLVDDDNRPHFGHLRAHYGSPEADLHCAAYKQVLP